MQRLKIIAITHKRVSIDRIGCFHLENEHAAKVCPVAHKTLGLEELMFMSTCNRVEFVVVTEDEIDNEWLGRFFGILYPHLDEDKQEDAVLFSEVYEGLNAVEHLFSVTSSLDSLVVGEREIITQVRTAFEFSNSLNMTGDLTRLILRKTVETAKEIYTQTDIATRSISVVSLAYQQLLEIGIPSNSNILLVGAGETNTTLARFLKKHGFGTLTIYNRSMARAERLATELGGTAHQLGELEKHQGGFDFLFACTAAGEPTVSEATYRKILGEDTTRKVLIDLGVPSDIDPTIDGQHNVHRIGVTTLESIAARNLAAREKEMQLCRAIIGKNLREFMQMYRERRVELAMREVPGMIKTIRKKALTEVFNKEMETLDPESREVLEKVVQYMEKKYISGPMRMAKEIMLQKDI